MWRSLLRINCVKIKSAIDLGFHLYHVLTEKNPQQWRYISKTKQIIAEGQKNRTSVLWHVVSRSDTAWEMFCGMSQEAQLEPNQASDEYW